ncbi:MAG: D-alanine--D-alanine ligase [Christensenellaceae bacterium]|nr:D-alanine--D-alanine ligase [Christensenellaceae bacterium]
MKIVVLAGGSSTEREVSLTSGCKVAQSLRRSGHKVVLLDAFLGREEIPADPAQLFELDEEIADYKVSEDAPDIESLKASRPDSGFGSIGKNVIAICRAADIVYMGLHGENGENGRMQALFDVLEIPYTGSGYLGSAMAMNKGVTKQVLLQSGICTPAGRVFMEGDDLAEAQELGLPCVVKVCSGGSSIGVTIAGTAEERQKAMEEAIALEGEVLVEAYVKGREFSVGVLGEQVLPPIEIVPKGGWYDYAHKYQAGWTEEICPADLTPEQTEKVQAAALGVFHALKLDVYGRIDFLLDSEDNFWCLEANTLPGMTPTSLIPQEAAAAGMDYDTLCREVVRLSLNKKR